MYVKTWTSEAPEVHSATRAVRKISQNLNAFRNVQGDPGGLALTLDPGPM